MHLTVAHHFLPVHSTWEQPQGKPIHARGVSGNHIHRLLGFLETRARDHWILLRRFARNRCRDLPAIVLSKKRRSKAPPFNQSYKFTEEQDFKVNIHWLAENAGTSVEQLERFYLKNLAPSVA